MPSHAAREIDFVRTNLTADQEAIRINAAAGISVKSLSTFLRLAKNKTSLAARQTSPNAAASRQSENSSLQRRKMNNVARNRQNALTSLTVLARGPLVSSAMV